MAGVPSTGEWRSAGGVGGGDTDSYDPHAMLTSVGASSYVIHIFSSYLKSTVISAHHFAGDVTMVASSDRIFRLDLSRGNTLGQRLLSVAERPLEKVFALAKLDEGYRQVRNRSDEKDFLDKILDTLNVEYEVDEPTAIPREGPAVVVANHPYGAIEGVILGAMLRRLRPDVKILANSLISRVPEMREMCIFVDPFERGASVRRNLSPLREAISWVRLGGMLVVFPSGTVSHLHLSKRAVMDPAWNDNVAGIIRRTGAPVLPVYFDGRNGALFQVLGLLHRNLRTALLPRELLNKRRRTIGVRVGTLIPFRTLRGFRNDATMVEYLRLRTYLLGNRTKPASDAGVPPAGRSSGEAVADGHPTELITADVEALIPENVLVEAGDNIVLHATSREIPHVLHEIGRLREITFRQVGEGTGTSLDLDDYDDYYVHLFVWNRRKNEIVGAYRLGQTDSVLRSRGVRGLYSSTLFEYKGGLFDEISPALELGRSFVRHEYQRSFSSLLLLWKGIASFVSVNPKYRYLFGPVSISNDYGAASRQLMVNFLKEHRFHPGLARYVKPTNPLNGRPVKGWNENASRVVTDAEELSALVAELEWDGKGLPILLKQYLKLGGRFLGFNVDRGFADALDGLILVDLTKTEPRTLARYMGGREAEQFRDYHRQIPFDGYGMHLVREMALL